MNKAVFIFIFVFITITAQSQIITSIAGNGTGGFTGDGLMATNVEVYQPSELFEDTMGNFYILVWNNRFRKVDTTGIITTILGDGGTGYNTDGTVATAAQFDGLVNGAFDKNGNLIFADANNMRIRKMDAITGIIITIAGTGVNGYTGDSILATNAAMSYPNYLVIDNIGNIFFQDLGNYRVRKIDTNGIITTYAGTGVSGDSGDGGPATAAVFTGLNGGLAFDPNWNLLIGDRAQYKIRKVDRSTGIITHFAGTGTATYISDGIPATAASFVHHGFACDAIGNVYIAGDYNERVYKVDTAGIFHSIAGTGILGYNGDGILATAAQLNHPYDVAIDRCGNVMIADPNNQRVRKVTIPPVFSIAATHGDTVCAGSSVTFNSAIATGGRARVGATTYQWYINGTLAISAASSYAYAAANGDSVRCVLTDITPCGDTFVVGSNTVHIVADSGIIPTISLSGVSYATIYSVVTVNATVAGAGSSYSINWYNWGTWFATTTVPTVTYTKTMVVDSITVRVVPASVGCYDSVLSAVHVVNDSALGIASPRPSVLPLTPKGEMCVWPNPAGDVVHVAYGGVINNIEIRDMVGKTWIRESGNGRSGVVNVASLPAGVYFVRVNGVGMGRFVKG